VNLVFYEMELKIFLVFEVITIVLVGTVLAACTIFIIILEIVYYIKFTYCTIQLITSNI